MKMPSLSALKVEAVGIHISESFFKHLHRFFAFYQCDNNYRLESIFDALNYTSSLVGFLLSVK
jgi:hypothetical protein